MSQFCVFCKSNNYKVTDVTEVIRCILLTQRERERVEVTGKIMPAHSVGEGETNTKMRFLTPCFPPHRVPKRECHVSQVGAVFQAENGIG